MEYVFVYSINFTAIEHGDEEPYLANYDIILEVTNYADKPIPLAV